MKNVPCPSPEAIFVCPYWKDFMCTMPENGNADPKNECEDYMYWAEEG